MPEPTCPFCEAPIQEDTAKHRHYLCGSVVDFADETLIGDMWTRGELCIARQRLFDDVLARIFVEANFLQNTRTIQEDLDASIEGARVVVAARYPLSIKDAADADQPK